MDFFQNRHIFLVWQTKTRCFFDLCLFALEGLWFLVSYIKFKKAMNRQSRPVGGKREGTQRVWRWCERPLPKRGEISPGSCVLEREVGGAVRIRQLRNEVSGLAGN